MSCTAASHSAASWYHFPYLPIGRIRKTIHMSRWWSVSPPKFDHLFLAHCQPCLKISCKSVWKFLRKVANRQTTAKTYPPWRRQLLHIYDAAVMSRSTSHLAGIWTICLSLVLLFWSTLMQAYQAWRYSWRVLHHFHDPRNIFASSILSYFPTLTINISIMINLGYNLP